MARDAYGHITRFVCNAGHSDRATSRMPGGGRERYGGPVDIADLPEELHHATQKMYLPSMQAVGILAGGLDSIRSDIMLNSAWKKCRGGADQVVPVDVKAY